MYAHLWSAAFLIAIFLAGAADAQAPARLRVSENRRFLEDASGRPFFYLGDTAWQLFHRLNREEADLYLRNRAAKGFTVVQAVLLAELGGLDEPNAYGDLALQNRDPDRPNEAYFRHADWIVKRANELGLVVGALPTWGSYWKQGAGQIFKPENAYRYGLFLGKRYRGASLIWILGGDQNVETPEERAIIDAMARGLREGDGGAHLITFHPRGPGQSSLALQDAPWLDFHMNQTSHGARDHDTGLFIERDLGLQPLRPTLDGEPRYELIPVGFYMANYSRLDRFDDFDVRQAAYWAILAGACGHTYGHSSVWQMWQPGRKPILWPSVPWREALDHPGAFQMSHVRRLFESRSFSKLVPDQTLLLNAPQTGGAKVRAARASDGSFVIVYSPFGEPFTMEKSRLPAKRLKEIWYDPRYGVAHLVHRTDNQGFQTYTPPTRGRGQDWVLILEDESAKLPALPGME
jgi:hypothetical protein